MGRGPGGGNAWRRGGGGREGGEASVEKWYPFHISSLEHCISIICCKCTVFLNKPGSSQSFTAMRRVSELLQVLSLETEMTDCPTLSYTTTCKIPTLSLQCRIQTEEIRGSRKEGTGGAVIQILRKGEKGGPGQQKNFFRPFAPQFGLKIGRWGGGGGGSPGSAFASTALTRNRLVQTIRGSFPGFLDCWHNIATTLYEPKSTRPSTSCTGTWKTLTLRKKYLCVLSFATSIGIALLKIPLC